MNLHRRLLLLLVAALMGTVTAVATAGPTFAQGGQTSVAPDQAKELATAWWQWALKKPLFEDPSVNPLEGNYTGGAQCDGKPVTDVKGKKGKELWFLAGSLGTDPITRTCTVKDERELFSPIVNTIFYKNLPTDTEQSLRQQSKDFMDSVLDDPDGKTFAEVDGKPISGDRIFRADTALFSFTQPVISDEPVDAVGDGLWVSLPALPKGQHTLHFGASAPNVDLDPNTPGLEGFSQDITYNLNVVSGKG